MDSTTSYKPTYPHNLANSRKCESDTSVIEAIGRLKDHPIDESYIGATYGTIDDEIENFFEPNALKSDKPLCRVMGDFKHSNVIKVFLSQGWRLHKQASVLKVFFALCKHGLLDLGIALRDLVELDYNPWLETQNPRMAQLRLVTRVLMECFEIGQTLRNPPRVALCDSYELPMKWLACVIIRGARDDVTLEDIVDSIIANCSEEFGAFSAAKFEDLWPHLTGLVVDDETLLTDRKHQGCYFVILPSGVKDEKDLKERMRSVEAGLMMYEDMLKKTFMLSEETENMLLKIEVDDEKEDIDVNLPAEERLAVDLTIYIDEDEDEDNTRASRHTEFS